MTAFTDHDMLQQNKTSHLTSFCAASAPGLVSGGQEAAAASVRAGLAAQCHDRVCENVQSSGRTSTLCVHSPQPGRLVGGSHGKGQLGEEEPPAEPSGPQRLGEALSPPQGGGRLPAGGRPEDTGFWNTGCSARGQGSVRFSQEGSNLGKGNDASSCTHSGGGHGGQGTQQEYDLLQ